MLESISKLGLIFVIIYIVIAIAAIIYSIYCGGMMCDIMKHLPIIHWISIFNRPENKILEILMIIGLHLLNIIILYFLGMGISMGIGYLRN